ncbi:uncharacterized protein LOC143428332, partial [Xylocopa sonorina]|uniref:uncharacterized protein LOC143428332 n=1 Tax=Xylocopa sonorina TaxID=1818115 RepID=UPI00403A8913
SRPEPAGAVDPHDANRLLFVHVLACLLSGFLVAVLNATYLALFSGFQQKSRDGLTEAIERYTSDVATKARVDAVQTELECCGDNSYEDWFRVPWLKVSIEGPEDVEMGPRLEEQSVPEEPEEDDTTPPVDVPFSCCSNDIPKPCVHHDILTSNTVYNYDPKHLTISVEGCRSRIISRGELIRTYLAGYLALLSVYQMVLSLMARLLQTAHSNELYVGPRKTRYHVWVFFRPDEFPENGDEEPRPRGKHARRSKRKLSASFATSSDEEETRTQRSRNRKSNSKMLTKIRSKIASVKSKSLPAVIRSSFRSNDSRGKTRSARKLEEQIDRDEERKLLSNRVAKSDIVTKKHRESVYSLLSDNSSTTELPSPPPPPPPFVVTLDMETEQDRVPVETVPSKSSKTELNAVQGNFIANQNSGRRAKVLERFVKIWDRSDRATQYRESGGADDPNDSRRSSKRKIRAELSSTDIYDRFRGSLQHTLARRDAIRAQNESRRFSRPIAEEGFNYGDVKRSNVLARLRCNNVPPCYRLLAEFDNHERAVSQTHPIPPPPPLPPPPNTYSRDSKRIRERKTLQREQRHCAVCNRPVQQTTIHRY